MRRMEQKPAPTFTPFEAFVQKVLAVPKSAIREAEARREKIPRFRRKPKEPAG